MSSELCDALRRVRPGVPDYAVEAAGRRHYSGGDAGFEPLNPALATTGTLPDDPQSDDDNNPYWWWNQPWYEHQNMRDERVEAFASLVRGGVHEYTYYARATTPGEFVAPPAKAEEMYHPETFGRTGTAKVVVEP